MREKTNIAAHKANEVAQALLFLYIHCEAAGSCFDWSFFCCNFKIKSDGAE